MENVLDKIKNTVVVSVQAMPSEPLYLEKCMIAMMKSVINGGAGGLRVAGIRDIANAKRLFKVPVIGITKPERIPQNYKEIVYITPTIKRPNDEKLQDLIKYVHIKKKIAMADVSTIEEGIKAQEAGADALSTTLAGYTMESINSPSDGPDFGLLEELVKQTDLPVMLEGRIWEPWQVDKAFEIGAHSVVIGSAITRPQLITKRFVFRNK